MKKLFCGIFAFIMAFSLLCTGAYAEDEISADIPVPEETDVADEYASAALDQQAVWNDDVYELKAESQYPELIGEPAELVLGGEKKEIADGVFIAAVQKYRDVRAGMDVIEMYVENRRDSKIELYSTRMSLDGVEMSHSLFESMLPRHRTFMYLVSMHSFTSIFNGQENAQEDFNLLIFDGASPTPLYNNKIRCILNEDTEPAEVEFEEAETISLSTADIKVYGFKLENSPEDPHVFLLVGVRNTTETTNSYLMENISFDGCLGVNSIGLWCDPEQYGLLCAEVDPGTFYDMVEDEEKVEVSFDFATYKADENSETVPYHDGNGETESVEIYTGMIKD